MQLGLKESGYFRKEKVTRQQRFLQEMDCVVPWAEMEKRIAPYYDKTGAKGGRPPIGLGIMLRIHFLQQWFGLSDPGMEEKLYEVPSMCVFAGIDRSLMDVPDETTILNFRHLLEKHHLAQALFDCVKDLLTARGLLLMEGTLVDATLIDAPSSTKNNEGRRDPEMHSTKKGDQWYFGMKAHIGVDANSGLVHTVVGTAANAHDVTQAADLLHGEETYALGDAGYQGVQKRPEHEASDTFWITAMRPGKVRALPDNPQGNIARGLEKIKAGIRAKVEHPFRVIKCQFGHTKVRYRGLAKNTAQLITLFALSNLWMVRNKLLQETAG